MVSGRESVHVGGRWEQAVASFFKQGQSGRSEVWENMTEISSAGLAGVSSHGIFRMGNTAVACQVAPDRFSDLLEESGFVRHTHHGCVFWCAISYLLV